MSENGPAKEVRKLRKSNYVFLAVWLSGIAIFALRWFNLAPKWFDTLFYICVAAVMILALTSAPSVWRVFKNGKDDQSDT